MKREDFKRAYEPLPEALEGRVRLALAELKDEQKPARRLTLRTAAIVLAIMLALGGMAYAIFESRTANLFGWFYGDGMKEELLQGDIAPMGLTCQLGDVVYTLDEVVWSQGVLYGMGHIAAADGARIVLLGDDYSASEPVGYLLHYGDEDIPDDAKTYAELAAETGSRIVHAHVSPMGYTKNGVETHGDIGKSELPRDDGSIEFMFEMYGEFLDGKETEIERGQSYELHFTLHNWEVTPEGEWLREEPNNTWLKTDWIVTVVPEVRQRIDSRIN